MTPLAHLHRTVASALGSGRLGRPVFVRYHAHGLVPSLEPLRQAAAQWLGTTPHVLRHLTTSTQSVELLQSDEGAILLLAHDIAPTSEGLDLTVLGTHGALGMPFEPHTLPAWDVLPTAAQATPGRYGVLLICGSHTHQENYAAAFASDPRCTLVALTDEFDIDPVRRERNAQLARFLKVPYIVDLEEALGRSDVDLVSVCAPPERRARIIVRCAAAGKHLYLDKSLAPSLSDVDAIVEAVRKAGVRSHMFSFVPATWARRGKRLLDEGYCGTLRAIHADVFFAKGRNGTAQPGRRREQYPPERHQLVEAKREMDNVGVYPLVLIRWLTGQSLRDLRCVTGNAFFAEHQRHDVEDIGVLAGTLSNGIPITIASGRYGWTSHPSQGAHRIILVGSERTLVLDAHRPRLETCTDEPPWTPPPVNPADPMAFWQSTQDEVGTRPKKSWVPIFPALGTDASYFLDCLDAGRDSEVTASEAAHAAEALLAGYLSAATEATVTLPLPRP